MKFSIMYFEGFERPWLLKRDEGTYSQHSHFKTKKEAERVKCLLENNRYPKNKKEKYAMQRLLTEEEFKRLNKKQRYINPKFVPCKSF